VLEKRGFPGGDGGGDGVDCWILRMPIVPAPPGPGPLINAAISPFLRLPRSAPLAGNCAGRDGGFMRDRVPINGHFIEHRRAYIRFVSSFKRGVRR